MAPPVLDDEDDEVKGDMTPMIDIIFLLLIFFLLTTKFIPDEKVLGSLLPADKGQAAASAPIEEPNNCNILIYPWGYPKNQQPSFYDNKWHTEGGSGDAALAVGGNSPTMIDGSELAAKGEDNPELEKVHGYIHGFMDEFEKGGPRKDQDPVIIHCFSGMPWKFALAAYDAVRRWEAEQVGKVELSPEDMQNAREVTFAPPRLRDYREWEMGYELFEIIHMK